jgi:hypothetical protein
MVGTETNFFNGFENAPNYGSLTLNIFFKIVHLIVIKILITKTVFGWIHVSLE